MSYFISIHYGPKPIEILHIDRPIKLKEYLVRRLSPLGYTITVEADDARRPDEKFYPHPGGYIFTMQFGADHENRNVITFLRLTNGVKRWFQEWIDQAEREYINRNLIDKL